MNWKLNPFAVVFWIFCGLVGFIFGGLNGAAIAAVSAMSVSFALSLMG